MKNTFYTKFIAEDDNAIYKAQKKVNLIADYDEIIDYLKMKIDEVEVNKILGQYIKGEDFFDDFTDYVMMREKQKAHTLGLTDEEINDIF